jgi:phage repressor protein C with HTH and peptisase S24 domain
MQRYRLYSKQANRHRANSKKSMLIINRIKKIIEYKKISTRRFCIEVGIANGFFDKVKDVGSEKLLKILNTYSDISAEWLLTGKGEMLRREYMSEGTIRTQPPNAAMSELPDAEALIAIPILDVSAAAGIGGALNETSPELLGVIKIPTSFLKRRGAKYYCGHVRGDSMWPTLLNRDYIIVRLLYPDEWINIRDNEIYFIVDRLGTSYVKRIENRLKDDNRLVCKSDNSDSPEYHNFNILGNEIANIFQVEWRISNNTSNIMESLNRRATNLRLNALEERMNKLTEKPE